MSDVINLRFERRDGGTVVFSEKAASTVIAFRQLDSFTTEAGGILLGRLIVDSADVVIDQVTTPTKSDRRSRFLFWRSRRSGQGAVNEAWEKSEQTRNYLGEWHTHPEENPFPSGKDLENWKRIGKTAKYEQGFLLFGIVGTSAVKLWELSRKSGELYELT